MDYQLAFIETDYIIEDSLFLDEPYIINIGNNHNKLDEKIHEGESWAFITAWNPLPEILSYQENQKRNQELEKVLKQEDYKVFAGYGIAKNGLWKEASLFVISIGRNEAIDLGKQFGQLAIVVGKYGGKAELVMID